MPDRPHYHVWIIDTARQVAHCRAVVFASKPTAHRRAVDLCHDPSRRMVVQCTDALCGQHLDVARRQPGETAVILNQD